LKTNDATGKRLSTRQLLKKVPNVPCLYRHKLNLRYYGIKSVRGKLISEVLKTEHGEPITDRKLAEHFLKSWNESHETGTSATGAPQTLEALIERYRQTKAGLKEKTKINVEWTIKNLWKRWTLGKDKRIREIRVSDLDAMLAKIDGWTPRTFNTFTMFLRQIFQVAVDDGTIAFNPVEKCKNAHRKNKKISRPTPTPEEAEKIVAQIRGQKFTDHAEDSADMAEFLLRAGLGQNEARRLTWGDLDLTKTHFTVERGKTGKVFDVPFYPALRKFLEDLYKRAGEPARSEKVFKVKDIKHGLQNACTKLGYHQFSPIALRRCAIVALLRAGIDYKQVAKWQGHSDGGQLIVGTYSEIVSSAEKEHELKELAKLEPVAAQV
jgi:integrase